MSSATRPDLSRGPDDPSPGWSPRIATGVIVLADGAVIEGFGVGATGSAVGEICFNTAMTGYEEILTDPSYAAQIITFTFPHIGIVGVNDEDIEVVNASGSAAIGAIMRADIAGPSNFRAKARLDSWLKARGIVGVTGVDTRALTTLIRERGMPNAVIAHSPDGAFDLDALRAKAAALARHRRDGPRSGGGLDPALRLGRDAAGRWRMATAGARRRAFTSSRSTTGPSATSCRLLNDVGCAVTVVPATASAEDIMALKPDGVVLSNGPGDPAATGEYAVPTIQALLETKVPLFGVCLGHQLLGLAVGAQTVKMPQGHHGANHPVKDFTTGKVEVVSMNHGFAVDRASLPANAEETHVSLFDGSNCGIALADRPAFSVQYHPEASPGPRDSHYLFQRFVDLIAASKAGDASSLRARAPAHCADRLVGEFLDADVDDHVALHPRVDRANQRFAHLREIEAVEMIEVDRIVAVDVAKRLIDQDRIRRHRRRLERVQVDGVTQEHDRIALDRAILDARDVDLMRLARFRRLCDSGGRAPLAHGQDLVGAHLARNHGGDRREPEEHALDHSRDRLQARAV